MYADPLDAPRAPRPPPPATLIMITIMTKMRQLIFIALIVIVVVIMIDRTAEPGASGQRAGVLSVRGPDALKHGLVAIFAAGRLLIANKPSLHVLTYQ